MTNREKLYKELETLQVTDDCKIIATELFIKLFVKECGYKTKKRRIVYKVFKREINKLISDTIMKYI